MCFKECSGSTGEGEGKDLGEQTGKAGLVGFQQKVNESKAEPGTLVGMMVAAL